MAVTLTEIKDITSLAELAKFDSLIRRYTYQIGPSQKEQLDDIIQDVYIKLHNLFARYPGKVIDGGYVAMTIKSVYLNEKKTYNNRMDFGNSSESSYIPDTPDNFKETLEDKLKDEEEVWEKYDEIINSLTWYDKKVHEHSLTMSLSELSRQSQIGYNSLIWTSNKIKAKLATIKEKK